jgi:hypothetical protein
MSKLTAYKAATAGRGWAYATLVVAGAASIAANIAHSYIPPTGALADWQPMAGKVISSVLWPVFLFLAVEVMSRVAWPKGFWMGVLRFVATLPVAAVTAIVSYNHASGLLAYYGEDAIVHVIGPIGIDGLMLGATAALLVTGKRRLTMTEEDAPATVPAPYTPPADPYAYTPPMPARPVDITPPARVAELHDRMASAAPSNASAPASAAEPAITSTAPRPAAETRRLYEALVKADPSITQEQAADKLGIKRWTLRSALEATAPEADRKRNMSETRQLFLNLKDENPDLTIAQGAAALNIPRVEVRDALATVSDAA